MPRTSIPRTLTELETLAQSVTPEVRADLPQIERALVKLQNLLEETKKLLAGPGHLVRAGLPGAPRLDHLSSGALAHRPHPPCAIWTSSQE